MIAINAHVMSGNALTDDNNNVAVEARTLRIEG